MSDNQLDDYMMLRSHQMVTSVIDEVGIENAKMWFETLLLNMLCLANLPPHKSPEYFKEMSNMYVAMREMNDKRVLN